MKKRSLILLFLIIVIGSFLRLYKLDKFPPSLFGDEIDVGYQAYSILKTGKDYMGQPWPVSFHSVSDWRTPLFLYATVPSIAIFGLTEWGVRLPPAFFGIITLPLFFFFLLKIFKDEKVALVGMFFMAVSIWHLQYSRAAFEVTQMLFLILAGLLLFLKGLENWRYFIPSAICLALTPYSYNTAKFFLPVLLLALFFSYKEKLFKIGFKRLFLIGIVFFVVSLPMARDVLFGQGGNRFSILSIFTDPVTVPKIGFARQTDAFVSTHGSLSVGMKPSFSSRFFHNKFLSWGLTLMSNYFEAFSTNFLFLRGDINYRHSVQGGFGHLYWSDAIFLVAGIFFFFLKFKDKRFKTFFLFWFFLSPIPSVLTRDGGGHATRLILLLPPFLILIAYGAVELFRCLQQYRLRKIAIVGFGIFFLLEFSLYLHRYYVHYPLESEEWWHCGFKEAAEYIKKEGGKYKYIVISDKGEPPLIFSLFWLGIDPKIPQENKIIDSNIDIPIRAVRFGETNYYLGSEAKEKQNRSLAMPPDILYIAPEGEWAADFPYNHGSVNILKTIYFPSGRVNKLILSGKAGSQ